MKKKLLRTVAAIMAICTLATASSLSGSALTTGTRVTENAIYYTADGKDTGIKTLNYDGINFFDCTNCTKSDVNTNFLYNALTRPISYQDLEGNEEDFTILQRWADVAGAVFENGGKYTCSHNYSEYYGKNHHSDSSEQCYVAEVLSKPKSVTHANKKYDNYHSTGLSMAGSFNELRKKMCDEISDRIFRYALEPEDILDQGNNCPDALPELSDETPRDILYNIVTSITQEGASYKYQYNSYGLAFYDFDLKIIDAANVDYVQDVSKTKKTSSAENNIVNTTKNNTLYDTTASAETGISRTESISTSISKSESYSYDEMFGTSCEIGVSSFLKGVIQSSLNLGQVFSSSKTNEETIVSSTSNAAGLTYTVPAHTIVDIEQSVCTDSMTVSYDVPVALTFKVVIFSMSGDVYCDDMFICALSTAGYEQSNFTTFFGSSENEEEMYAYEALANKLKYAKTSGWDSIHGDNHFFYKEHDGHSDPTDTTRMDLNWSKIANTYNSNTGIKDGIVKFASRCPMLPTGATTTTTVKSINTTLSDPVPMYLPSSFKVVGNDQKSFYLFTDGVFNLNTISVGAFDRYGASYYDFMPSDGTWTVKAGSEDVIDFDASTYTVKAKGVGTGYLTWSLKNDVEYTAAYDNGTVTKDDKYSFDIAFVVREYPFNSFTE